MCSFQTEAPHSSTSGKLSAYSLSPDHPVGGNKALLFDLFLGLTAADTEVLRDLLLHVAAKAESLPSRSDEFGQRYTIDFTLEAPKGTAQIRSGWIVWHAEDFPRLTTCYVLRD